MRAGVPDVADSQGGDESERLAPVDPRVARKRGVTVAPGSPTGATGRTCGVFSDEVASSGPQVRRFRWPQGGVHAVAPGAVEAHPVGGIGRQELRLGTIEQAPNLLSARRIAAQEPMIPERPEIAGLGPGCPPRLLQGLVEVEALHALALLADL
jgi:hypothetical protein